MNRKRIRDYGVKIGKYRPGARNKITDVPGVTVGHYTVDDARHKTGVTVIIPAEGNLFTHKLTAAAHVINGFGKTCGTVQVQELGTLETPIALTNTLNVGKAADALVGYTVEMCERDGVPCRSVNPVVGETNDSGLNDITDRCIGEAEVKAAIAAACLDFDEGDVGAGKGTVCFGLKGGIGSSSRVLTIDGKEYTVGALVQSNFGVTSDLMIAGVPVGRRIAEQMKQDAAGCDKGSIMIVIGTDIPLTELQLNRVLRHAVVGLARTGSYVGHGSGDVVLGFTTANRREPDDGTIREIRAIPDSIIDCVFRGTAESVEEAVLNSLTAADAVTGYTGKIRRSLNEFLPQLLD
ncbi:MAG: P1 family peptidase [Clostridia bacterium]|nr:P1 family peptidase [Clostridia bacterium]